MKVMIDNSVVGTATDIVVAMDNLPPTRLDELRRVTGCRVIVLGVINHHNLRTVLQERPETIRDLRERTHLAGFRDRWGRLK